MNRELKRFINLLKGKHWCPTCNDYCKQVIRTCYEDIPASGYDGEKRKIKCTGTVTICSGCYTRIKVTYVNIDYYINN